MFNRLFGAKGEKKSGTSMSLEELNSAIDLIEKREEVLEKQIEGEMKKAKEFYAKKNTQRALQHMKRKKQLEEQLLSLGSQKQNMETLKFTIQNQNMNQEVLKAQVKAKDELKKGNKKMNADKIDENMDDLRDEMDKAQQVSEALQQPLDSNFVDEDELMMELEMELEGDAAEELPTFDDALPTMPQVPSNKLPQPAKKNKTQEEADEDALRALEAELAM